MIRILRSAVAISLFLLVAVGVRADAWRPGEKLEYKVYFGFFNAGTAVFTAGPEQALNGRRAMQFKSVLQSAPRFFIRVYDEAISLADPVTYTTYRYDKIQREGDENSRNTTVYNHTARTAVRTEDGTAHPAIQIGAQPKDVLSAIYYVRTLPLATGRTYSIPVHDGKRDYTMKVTVGKAETIRTPAGSFNCLKVEPRLYASDGTLKKKGQMTLWMTNDERHIPIRIKMSLTFGSLVADLTKAE